MNLMKNSFVNQSVFDEYCACVLVSEHNYALKNIDFLVQRIVFLFSLSEMC